MKKEAKKYGAIIFDLDGTLINSLPSHLLAFKKLWRNHKIAINYSHLKKSMGLSTEKIILQLKKKYKFSESVQDLHNERRNYYFEILGNKDISFPGVKNLLKNLKKDYKIGIATSSSKITLNHSLNKSLRSMFDFMVTIENVKRGKPFPDELLLAAKKLNVKPQNCLVIGDSIYDGMSAKNAKMDFIGVLTGYNSKKELSQQSPKAVIKRLADLPKFLR